MNNLEKAKELLNNSEYTCVLCSNEDTLTSNKRGVAPLIQWIDEHRDLNEYSAADKIVGNGAAFLYILLGVKELYAGVISETAVETLNNYKISVSYDLLTEAIVNRDNTGFCPIESAVMGIKSPEKALSAIRSKLNEMKKP